MTTVCRFLLWHFKQKCCHFQVLCNYRFLWKAIKHRSTLLKDFQKNKHWWAPLWCLTKPPDEHHSNASPNLQMSTTPMPHQTSRWAPLHCLTKPPGELPSLKLHPSNSMTLTWHKDICHGPECNHPILIGWFKDLQKILGWLLLPCMLVNTQLLLTLVRVLIGNTIQKSVTRDCSCIWTNMGQDLATSKYTQAEAEQHREIKQQPPTFWDMHNSPKQWSVHSMLYMVKMYNWWDLSGFWRRNLLFTAWS